MKVRFTDVDEFLGELERDARSGAVEGKILRVVKRWTPSSMGPNFTHLSVVAGYIARSQLVELERYCGMLWGKHFAEQDRPILDKANEIAKRIEEGARALDLDIRGGAFLEESE